MTEQQKTEQPEQSECPPCPTSDIVIEKDGRKVTIDLSPLEWIILGISASAIAATANVMVM